MILNVLKDWSGQNIVDQDQTGPPKGAVWSGSTLFAIQSASFEYMNVWLNDTGPSSG